MEANDHPEVDDSPFLDEEMTTKYQMLIRCANWAVILGRFDILYTVNTMGRFSFKPREGHLKRMLRLFGHLKYHKKEGIIFDVVIPDVSSYEIERHNWSEIYPNASEELPYNMPEPKGKPVRMITYFDANHVYDIVNRRSTTGVLLFLNRTPIKWYSKRQNTVESSTYGSELVAGRIATDIMVEYRQKLRMLGVPILDSTLLFGDNKSVIMNTTLPSSNLKKKHNAIAYHPVREAVAAGVIDLVHILGVTNISDILTNLLNVSTHAKLLRPVIF